MNLSFFKNLVFLTFILAVIIAVMKYIFGYYDQGNIIWYSLAFYFILTILSVWWVLRAKKEPNRTFITRYFMSTGLRIIFCGAFLAIYLISSPERDRVFVFTFMILYLFYTIFEIYYLVAKLRREN